MRKILDGWTELDRGLSFLAAMAVAGAILSGLVIGAWGPVAGESRVAADVADQGMHNLPPAVCRATVTTLMDLYRSDPRVLWVWVEESAPTLSSLTLITQDTGVRHDAPRPYAFRPDVKEMPAGVCRFAMNSVHASSLGGVAGAVLAPETDLLIVGVGI